MRLRYTTTTFPKNKRQTEEAQAQFQPDTGIENQVLNLHPEVRGQVFEGFGGAFTESAGYVYSMLSPAQKQELLSQYFDVSRMNYQFGRLTLDSCDFSLGEYEAMSDESDRDLESFSLRRLENYVMPFVCDAQKASPKTLKFMLSPWSPPAFMKTNGKRSGGGKLRKGYEAFWADYISKYILELRKLGVQVDRLSLQNEPQAVQTWDSCIYTAQEEKAFLRDYLYPALRKNGLADVEIFIWDHNKERLYERACAMIDEDTSSMIAGIAFHWYSGDHFEALDLFQKKFPEKKLIMSEACIEYYKFGAGDHLAHAQKYAHDMIGNLNGGMNAFYDWNLVLDGDGGPNHADNFCDAPYLFNQSQRVLAEQNTLAYLWHFSHYIQPGAVRIGFSRYTAALEMTAFHNPDGTLVGIILNQTTEASPATVRLLGQTAEIQIKPEAIISFQIDQF